MSTHLRQLALSLIIVFCLAAPYAFADHTTEPVRAIDDGTTIPLTWMFASILAIASAIAAAAIGFFKADRAETHTERLREKLADLDTRVTKTEAAVTGVKQALDEFKAEVRQDFQDLKHDLQEMREESRKSNSEILEEIRRKQK